MLRIQPCTLTVAGTQGHEYCLRSGQTLCYSRQWCNVHAARRNLENGFRETAQQVASRLCWATRLASLARRDPCKPWSALSEAVAGLRGVSIRRLECTSAGIATGVTVQRAWLLCNDGHTP